MNRCDKWVGSHHLHLLSPKEGKRIRREVARPLHLPPHEQETSQVVLRELRVYRNTPDDQALTSSLLRVKEDQGTVHRGRRVRLTQCGCGRQLLLTAEEVAGREAAGLGCGLPDCSAVPSLTRLWYDLSLALRVQVAQAAAVLPGYRKRVQGAGWTVEEAAQDLLTRGGAQFEPDRGRIWARSPAFFSRPVTRAAASPDGLVFPERALRVVVDGFSVPAPEVALAYSIPYRELFEVRCHYWDWEWLPRYKQLFQEIQEREETDVYELLIEQAPKYNTLRVGKHLVIRGYVGPSKALNKELETWGLIRNLDYFLRRLKPEQPYGPDVRVRDYRLIKASEKLMVCNT